MNRTTMRRTLAGAALVALLGLAGCGGAHDGGGHSGAGTPTGSGPSAQVSADFNDSDVMFAQMMIPHHQQAVEMAELAETRASDPALKGLAAGIKAAQAPEIATMTGWLTAWGQPLTPGGGHNMSEMDGMVAEKDMAALKAASGAEFDRMFAKLMIEHHEGAIQMARTEKADGANAEARALAEKIAADQAAEVQTLKKFAGQG
ncbi:MAG TPA: DUF305 domain-containing protein [Micromonospora sp.]